MPVENSTPNRDYQLPYEFNELKDDVSRVIAALMAIDLDIANVFIALAGKAAGVHSHAITDVTGLAAALEAKLASAERGIANGVASLDASGKVPSTQLPTALFGALAYQGTWNANTNTPTIPAASSSNKGYYFKVSVAGSTAISGINDWKIGDWIVSNGTAWDKVDNTERVQRVAGLEGDISVASLRSALASVVKTGDTMTGPLSVPAGGTGSQVIRASEVPAHAFKLISTIAGTNSNLNDYTAPGLYHQNLSAGATAGENYPSAQAGLLIVHESPTAFVYQTYVTYGSDSTIYFRAKYQTNWYPWRTVIDSRGGSFEGGISFGSEWAAAANNLSRHIALYGSTVGINAYNNGMNHVVEDGYTFAWYQGGSRAALISAASHFYSKGNMYVGGVRTSNGPATLGFKTFSSGAYDTASIVATGGTSGDTGSATLSALCSEFQINGNIVLHSGDLVSQAEAEAGVATEPRVWSAERVRQAALAAQGVEQAWQNVLASRAYNTVYQNTTGKPITVNINAQDSQSTAIYMEVSADNATWTRVGWVIGFGNGGGRSNITTIVPDGWYYRLGTGIGSTINIWAELR